MTRWERARRRWRDNRDDLLPAVVLTLALIAFLAVLNIGLAEAVPRMVRAVLGGAAAAGGITHTIVWQNRRHRGSGCGD